MAAPVFFPARVIYKVATEAEWNTIVLDELIKGEFYFYVEPGDPNNVINIKVGDGVRQPSELPYFWDASIRVPFFGTATPSSTPSPATGSGFWIATEAGTYTNYGGVVLPANSIGVITRIGTSYSIVTISFDFSGFATTQQLADTNKKIDDLLVPKGTDIKGTPSAAFLNDTGTITGSSSWSTAYRRSVTAGQYVGYRGIRPNTAGAAAIVAYDASDNVTVLLDNQGTGLSEYYSGYVLIPTGTVLVSGCGRNLTGDEFFLTMSVNNISGNVKGDRVEGLDAFKDEFYSVTTTRQGTSPLGSILGTLENAILQEDGTKVTSANWRLAEDRAVQTGDIVKYYGVVPYGDTTPPFPCGMLGKNSSGSITVLVPQRPSVQGQETIYIEIPDGIVSISANSRMLSGDVFTLDLVEQTVVDANMIEGLNDQIGKKSVSGFYLAVGDSLTAQDGTVQGGELLKGIQSHLLEKITFNDGYYNGGFSGHSLSSSPVAGRENDCIVRRLGEYPVNSFHKYVTVLALTNDFRLDCLIGTTADFLNDTGDTTVYGAFKVLVDYIYDQDSHANIIFITPFQRNNGGYSTFVPNPAGFTLLDYIDAMLWVAKRLSIPVVNLMDECGINPNNFGYYLRDGLHPNNLGYQIIGNIATQNAIKYFI